MNDATQSILRDAAHQSAEDHFDQGATSTANLPMAADFEHAAFDLDQAHLSDEEARFFEAEFGIHLEWLLGGD